jgi:hypothetical protein
MPESGGSRFLGGRHRFSVFGKKIVDTGNFCPYPREKRRGVFPGHYRLRLLLATDATRRQHAIIVA